MIGHRVVAHGAWHYSDGVWLPVRVIESTYDFWYALAKADGDLDPDENPERNADGLAYYVIVRPYTPGESFWADSQGFMSLDEARRGAEEMLPGPVDWSRAAEFPAQASSLSPDEWTEAESFRKTELIRRFKERRKTT